MSEVKIESLTLSLTPEEAYALCNKLTERALLTQGGFCEDNQIALLLPLGKKLGEFVNHPAKVNRINIDVEKERRLENK